MAIRQLSPPEWATYFGDFSREPVRKKRLDYAEIRVCSPDLGSHLESRWLPLRGITFDRKSRVLEVDVDGLGHLMYDPAMIYVDDVDRGLLLIDVFRSDGTQEIVELRQTALGRSAAAASDPHAPSVRFRRLAGELPQSRRAPAARILPLSEWG